MLSSKRLILLAFSCFGFTACVPVEEAPQYETREQPIERICGADRYLGPQGVDVSTYQQNFNWVARKNEGIQFGIARVSNGTQIIDDYFDRNWAEMKNNGILRGAYQYFRPGQDATAQANIMVNKLGRLGPGDLPAVIDVETTDGESAATVRQKVRTWLDIVERGTGKKPMIYTAAYFWRDSVGDTTLGEYPLWIANYGATCPLVPEGWTKWTLWQYCDGNPEYCSNGVGFDRNVFNGTDEELQQFANGSAFGAEFVEQSFPLASTTMMLTAGETTSGYFELRNSGSEPWTTATHLATTEPRDRESVFADDSWVASNRPVAVEGTVAPGATYRFEFNLRAPQEPGEYSEFFGLVQEGETWFSEPGQLGPPDNQLQVRIEVLPGDPDEPGPDAGVDGDVIIGGEPDAGSSTPDASTSEPDPDGLPPVVGPSPGLATGCSQAGGNSGGSSVFLLSVLGAVMLGRRRRG